MSRGSSEGIPPIACPPSSACTPRGVRESEICEPDAGFVATIHVANHLGYGAPTVFRGLRPRIGEPTPVGVTEISRGSSEAIPPVACPPSSICTLKGCVNAWPMEFRAVEWPADPGCNAPRRTWVLGWAPSGRTRRSGLPRRWCWAQAPVGVGMHAQRRTPRSLHSRCRLQPPYRLRKADPDRGHRNEPGVERSEHPRLASPHQARHPERGA